MCDSLENNDAAQPPVDQIIRIKRNPQQVDQRVIPPSKQKQRHHVNRRQHSGPIHDLFEYDLGTVYPPVDHESAKHHVSHKITHEEEGLKSRRQGSDVYRPRELEFAVVPHLEERGVQDVPFEEGSPAIRRKCEVTLVLDA